MSDAEVLNRIERKIRQGKKATDREGRLLVEGYTAYGIKMPKDILKKLK